MSFRKTSKKKSHKTTPRLDPIDEEWDCEIEREMKELELEHQEQEASRSSPLEQASTSGDEWSIYVGSFPSDQASASSASSSVDAGTGSDTSSQASTSRGASRVVVPVGKKKATGYIMFLHSMKREHGDLWETSEMTTPELICEFDHLWKDLSEGERSQWKDRAKRKNEKMNPMKSKQTEPFYLTPVPVVPQAEEAEEEEDEWGRPPSSRQAKEEKANDWGPFTPR